MTEAEARRALQRWRENQDRRDALIKAANAVGVTKHQIHVLTGLARTTIDRILQNGGKSDV